MRDLRLALLSGVLVGVTGEMMGWMAAQVAGGWRWALAVALGMLAMFASWGALIVATDPPAPALIPVQVEVWSRNRNRPL